MKCCSLMIANIYRTHSPFHRFCQFGHGTLQIVRARQSQKAAVSWLPTDFVSFRLLASRTFTFLVGPEKQPIDVHIDLIRSLSEPLDKLMNNGSMKESIEKVAVLEEVDVETFAQFAEFCYTHNYRAPPKAKPVKVVDGNNST